MQLQRIGVIVEQPHLLAPTADVFQLVDNRAVEARDNFRPPQIGRVVNVLDHHEANKQWRIGMAFESRSHKARQSGHGVKILDLQSIFMLAQGEINPLKHSLIQALFIPEIVVNHPLGGFGLPCDFVDPAAR